MLEEKVIINDVLRSTKSMLKNLECMIVETENIELRQLFQNMRNNFESFQFELFKIAESKGYYTGIPQSTIEEIQEFKNEISKL